MSTRGISIIVACAAVFAPTYAFAVTKEITYTKTITAQAVPFSTTVDLPAFNPALGTLTGVEVSRAYSGTATVEVENRGDTDEAFTNASASVPVTVSITLDGVTYSVSDTLTAAIGSGTAAPGSNSYPGTLSLGDTNQNPIPPLTPADFEGATLEIPFDVSFADGTFSGTGPRGLFFGGSATVGGSVDIQYTYTTSNIPETATWAMMGLGFAGLGLAGYRARRMARAIA